jgi:hypothetical protein
MIPPYAFYFICLLSFCATSDKSKLGPLIGDTSSSIDLYLSRTSSAACGFTLPYGLTSFVVRVFPWFGEHSEGKAGCISRFDAG